MLEDGAEALDLFVIMLQTFRMMGKIAAVTHLTTNDKDLSFWIGFFANFFTNSYYFAYH